MLIKCYYCEIAFRNELYLQQHFINSYLCNNKRNKINNKINTVNNKINNIVNNKINNKINNTVNNTVNNKINNTVNNKINNTVIIEEVHQSKLNRLKNRSQLNKIQSDIINFSKNADDDINIICKEAVRRLSEIL